MPAAGPDLTGQVVGISIRPVAEGGMGNVYHGTWRDRTKTPSVLALKFFRGAHLPKKRQTVERRLAREAGVWASLRHSNILSFYGTITGIEPYPEARAMISPWLSNGHIMDYITQHPGVNRAMLVAQVARGMEYLHHKRVVHGDFRGHNILIDKDGNAVISDFGRANIIDDEDYSTQLIAKAAWTAPELLIYEGPVPISFATDIWALGITVIEIFIGKMPWDKLKPAQIIVATLSGKQPRHTDFPQVPPLHWKALAGCWDESPATRPTAIMMRERLARFS
ncbi:kinase-like protein [Rickenella mellea]|uniref:Kinase-like protein n=1 Tax=Rickenella mellea TaxID=50990 RepID=A0A4Y7Q939_9AGAM|nr:kinase-like protein [Rickenella mellea]